jgi:serine/threonine-protein kinase RsbW
MPPDPAHPPPPGPAAAWEKTYPGTLDQAREVRAALGALLAGCPLAADVILLASELAANAITHSASGKPGGAFTVRLTHRHGDHVHAEVTDQGSSWPGDLPAAARHPHGLYLLQALSTRCGVRCGTPDRTVWFRIDYPRPPARHPARRDDQDMTATPAPEDPDAASPPGSRDDAHRAEPLPARP